MSSGDINHLVSNFLEKAKVGMIIDQYSDYSVERGVLNYCSSVGADLVGIPTHGRRGISHFFMGSIGEDLANHSSIPVITFKI